MKHYDPALIEHEIAVAASWWAEELKHLPAIQTGNDWNDVAVALFYLAMPLTPLSDKQIQAFQERLHVLLQEHIHQVGFDLDDPFIELESRMISVEYSPDAILLQAASDAGFDDAPRRFRLKTQMWINPGLVEVACGYGAKPETIYTSKRETL